MVVRPVVGLLVCPPVWAVGVVWLAAGLSHLDDLGLVRLV